MQIRFRVASTETDLSSATWLPQTNNTSTYFSNTDTPVDLNETITSFDTSLTTSNYMEIEIILTPSTSYISPSLYSMLVARNCITY